MLVLALSFVATNHAGLAPSLKTKPPSPATAKLDPDEIVSFTKNLYRDLGSNWNAENATVVTDKYRDQFQHLNESTAGQLGETLAALFEIRMLDLQASVRHARKMRSVIEAFAVKPADQVAI
jgi:hypothetical protein